MKFKKGDRFRVKANCRYKGGVLAGKAGTVVRVERHVTYPYEGKLDDETEPCLFHAIELERLEEL